MTRAEMPLVAAVPAADQRAMETADAMQKGHIGELL
jgi:hypothetical protein